MFYSCVSVKKSGCQIYCFFDFSNLKIVKVTEIKKNLDRKLKKIVTNEYKINESLVESYDT